MLSPKLFLYILLYSFLLLFIFINIGCKKGGNPVEVNQRFSGITETDSNGNIIGPIDKSDWLPDFDYPSDYGKIPRVLSVEPAYPNPTSRFVTFKFDLPSHDSVVVWLEDTPEGKDTTLLSKYLEAGQYKILIDLFYGDNTFHRKEGLVRLHFAVPTRKEIPKVHGDIEYKPNK